MFSAASANNYSIATPIGRLGWEMSLGSYEMDPIFKPGAAENQV
jgi:hypothetical protein